MRLNNNHRDDYEDDYRPRGKRKYEPVKKKNERYEDYLLDEDDDSELDAKQDY